jgi:hypothetical protein
MPFPNSSEDALARRTTREFPLTPAACWLVVVLLIGVALLRIVATYHVFNHTIDEGAHLACGMEWFQNAYTYDPKHTPIARIAIALLPYLDGLRGYGNDSYWQEGVLILSTGGRYWHNLTLARVGVLPFFALGVIMIFVWSRQLYGSATALMAGAIFSLLPVVLAHSGFATTDIPLTAVFLVAAFAFSHWLAAPNWRTAAGFGLATGLAISTKLSTLAFLPATMLGVLPLYLASRHANAAPETTARRLWGVRTMLGSAAIATLSVFVVIWPVYRFSHAPIAHFSSAPDTLVASVFGQSSAVARGVQRMTSEWQLPAPEFYDGLRGLRDINRLGPRSYLFGRVRNGGWWYFYPVAVAVKTPLAVLFFALIGGVSLGRDWWRTRANWERLVPLVAPLAIIVSVLPTRLDIGVRHVMPAFAFLSMLAAVGAIRLWNWRPPVAVSAGMRVSRWAAPMGVLVLWTWFIASSARAHPDYISYFNELAGSHPADILVISDVDWGQDFSRLSTYLTGQHAKRLSVASDNLFDAAALGLPESVRLKCGETATGWVAIEERRARVYPECYTWIAGQPMQTYIGQTLRVYHLPDSSGEGR